MEYLEILLRDVNKKNIDLLISKELNITNDSIISSHFFDKSKNIDKEYDEINSLFEYFDSPNTGNVYVKELILGEILTKVMVVMSFDEILGNITLSFDEEDFCSCSINDLAFKIKKILNKLHELQKKYDITKIQIGYESVIHDDNVILCFTDNEIKLINKFKGNFSDAIELVIAANTAV